MNDAQLIKDFAIKAGAIAMKYFGNNPEVSWKDETSPVSQADTEIDAFLQKNLLQARPEYGWLSEEIADNKNRLEKNKIFIVDPIDGTRGFIQNNSEWCISIAIVENNRPIVGVLHAPVVNQTFLATKNEGTWFFENEKCKKIICDSTTDKKILNISAPQKLFAIVEKNKPYAMQIEKMPSVISLAWRLAMVTKGTTDLVLVKENSCEWDIAAADIILSEANASLSSLDGKNLLYNNENVRQDIIFACNNKLKQQMLPLLEELK